MDTPLLPTMAKEIFNQAIWELARQVPPGKVATYGQLAAYVPVVEASHAAYRARWAGQAMAACPADVPWQRVINSQGMISPRPGADKQRALLEAEGVSFGARGRVDLRRYAWEGPDPAWLREHGLLVIEKDDSPPAQPSLF